MHSLKRVLFSFIALALSATAANKSLAEEPWVERAAVLRYDGTEITLSPAILESLLNNETVLRDIGENVTQIRISKEANVEQPAGVMVAVVSIRSKGEVDDEEALML